MSSKERAMNASARHGWEDGLDEGPANAICQCREAKIQRSVRVTTVVCETRIACVRNESM